MISSLFITSTYWAKPIAAYVVIPCFRCYADLSGPAGIFRCIAFTLLLLDAPVWACARRLLAMSASLDLAVGADARGAESAIDYLSGAVINRAR
ncbi:hypothetical protein LAD77_00695 [Klebsiella pneumoniae]|nr:hypothetical protein [Klebsiella pneumoniae]